MAVSMETVLKLTAQVSGANNIQQVGNSLKNLSAVSQMSERTIDKLYIATKQYGQAAGNSVNSINQQINALTNLRNAVDPTSNRYKVLTRDLQAYERQLQSLNATQQRQQALHSAGGAAAGALMMGGGMQGALGAGAGALAAAGPGGVIAGAGLLAGGALIGTGVGNAMDVATQTRAISTLSNDAAGLTARIQDLVREQGYLTDRATAGAAAYEILSSGFSSTDDVLKILRASSEGAAGGFSDIKTVADAATSILNGYGMSAENVTKIVDQMIVTQNDGKIKVDEYAKSIGRVVPTAVAAKVSLEEINGAISALSIQGYPIESIFSGINQAIKTILKPTDEAAKLAAVLGLQFNAQALAAKGLGGFLEDVAKKTGRSTEALSILFSDIDGFKAVVGLLNDDLQKFNRFTNNQATALNAAGSAARKAIDPVKQFDSAWKDFSATLGDLVLPAINATLKGATGLIQLLTSEQSGKALNNIFKLGSYSNLAGGGGIRELETAGLNGQLPAGASKPKARPFVVPGVGTFDGETQRLIPGTASVRLPATATPPNVAAAIAGLGKKKPKESEGLQGYYVQGGIGPSGPNAYGPHYDIKRVDNGYFKRNALDQFVSVNGRPLSSGVTVAGGQFGAMRDGGARTHNAWDYAFGGGAQLSLKGGAKWVSSAKGSWGDNAAFMTPDGQVYRIIHGTFRQTGKRGPQDTARDAMTNEEQQFKDAQKAQADKERIQSQARLLKVEGELNVIQENILKNRILIAQSTDQEFIAQRQMANFKLDQEDKLAKLKSDVTEVQIRSISDSYSASQKAIDLKKAEYALEHATVMGRLELEVKVSEQLRDQVKLIYEQADAAGILADETRRYSELAFGGRLPDSTFTTGMDLMGKNQQDSRIGMGAMDGVSSWLDSVGTMRQSFQSLATDGIGGLTDALTELTTTGTTNFREFTAQILRDTTRIIIAQMVLRPLLSAIGGGGGGAFNPQITLPTAGPGWAGFAEGGISSGPRSGYGAMLHGTEAIVPLSRGRAIPVQLSGGGGGGTAVTVNVDARGTQASGDNSRSEALGRDLSQVIDSRLAHHRRPGGLLA